LEGHSKVLQVFKCLGEFCLLFACVFYLCSIFSSLVFTLKSVVKNPFLILLRHALLTYKVLFWVQSSKTLAPLRVILKY
jgi:hypothetical protein